MDLLLRDDDLELGKSLVKTPPWDKPAFLAKHPLAGSYLPSDQARSFKSRCMRILFITLDRPDVQFASKDISRVMAHPTISADETLTGLLVLLHLPTLVVSACTCKKDPLRTNSTKKEAGLTENKATIRTLHSHPYDQYVLA